MRVLAALHRHHPLVQWLTITVVAGFTANVLLAVGAAPAMVDYTEESAEFSAMAGAILVNLGTLAVHTGHEIMTRAASPWPCWMSSLFQRRRKILIPLAIAWLEMAGCRRPPPICSPARCSPGPTACAFCSN
ncbi:hypothetical protein E3T46_16405 [Cryobacterium sp. Hh11]|nr:hydroxyethylthiazole kinase [Cryobacterium sp. Hh11]TFD47959.1 hypothetical protein E3T46_16405 [Cryobacterium sp. Hh11]